MSTKGTYTITSIPDGKIVGNGPIVLVKGCCLTNDSSAGMPTSLIDDPDQTTATIFTSCSTLANNRIGMTDLYDEIYIGTFYGPVECSHQGGNTTITTTTPTTNQQESSSSMAAGSSQDGDGDGIPDSSDKCTHNSNPKCFKEADASTTTTQSSSTTSMAGNQTR